jgi:hypothetical protein
MAEETPKRRPPISQLSKTPSWVMLGFILGALFVSALPRREPPAPRPIVLASEPSKRVKLDQPLLTTVEAVFAQWSNYAVWENDTTQVALWNTAVGDFAEFYEVRRIDDVFYFRSLDRLTNPPLRHGVQLPPECPLRFTESEEHYREWLEQGHGGRAASTPIERLEAPRRMPSQVMPPPTLTAGAGTERLVYPLEKPKIDVPSDASRPR